MIGYIVKRLFQSLVVLWAALTLMFYAFYVMPGDPVELKGGEKALTEEVRNNIREKYGLNDSIPQQYVSYLGRLVRFDLGNSYFDDSSVNQKLWDGVKTSGRLAFWGAMAQLFLSFTTGVIAAARRYSLVDRLTTLFTIVAAGIPVFVSGLLAQYLFGVLPGPQKWNWPQWARFPVQGFGPDTWVLGVVPTGHTWKHVVLPALIVSLVETAYLARLMRSSLLEVLRADYMRTAMAKGLRRRTVLLKHGVRNAAIPYVTYFGISVVTLFGVAVLTETVFALPGLGSQILQAAQAQDAPVVLGLSTVVILFGALMSLLVDLSYGWLDPRIRLANGGRGR